MSNVTIQKRGHFYQYKFEIYIKILTTYKKTCYYLKYRIKEKGKGISISI